MNWKRSTRAEETKKLYCIIRKSKSKKGMFEGDMEDGELEIGQVSALIDDILPVETVFNHLLKEFEETKIPSFKNCMRYII
jgi:enoyl-[acyl-carrier protein] reductase II